MHDDASTKVPQASYLGCYYPPSGHHAAHHLPTMLSSVLSLSANRVVRHKRLVERDAATGPARPRRTASTTNDATRFGVV